VRRRAAAEPQAATLRTLVEQQVANNSRSASLWDIYADHRRRLTDLVVSSARGSDLVVLGAGNANDLDLAALACRFERIHLADVDADIALAAHLRTLVALARPGARCLLVTDVVSSETQPLASLLANRRGEALLAHLEEQHGLFSGTSPQLARLMLAQDPELAPQVEDVALLEPWLWRISRSRTVLVYALAFSRRDRGRGR